MFSGKSVDFDLFPIATWWLLWSRQASLSTSSWLVPHLPYFSQAFRFSIQPSFFSFLHFHLWQPHCTVQGPIPFSPYLRILPNLCCNGANCQLLYTNAALDEKVNGREVSKETRNHLFLIKHTFISFNKLIKQLTDKAIKLN